MVKPRIVINNPPLDQGCGGIVFPVGDDYVIKIPKNEGDENKLVKEYNIQMELYSSGIRVPEPKQIADVFLEDIIFRQSLFLRREQRGILMQRLYGQSLEEIYHNGDGRFGNYIADCRKQIDIARSLGFRSGDIGIHNVIVNQKDNMVYLIDFKDWEKIRL